METGYDWSSPGHICIGPGGEIMKQPVLVVPATNTNTDTTVTHRNQEPRAPSPASRAIDQSLATSQVQGGRVEGWKGCAQAMFRPVLPCVA